MLIQYTMIARFLLLLVAVTLDVQPGHSPALAVLLLLVSAALLLPALRRLIRVDPRLLAPVPHGPPRPAPAGPKDVRTPADPGTPGSARPRAPSRGVPAFA